MLKRQMKKISSAFNTINLTKLLALLLLTIALIGLSSAIICIYVSKPIADDFGAINFYRSDVWLANTWNSLLDTGRYGQSIFGAIAYGLFGHKVSNILPLITLFWFMTLAYLYIKSFIIRFLKVSSNTNLIPVVLTILFSFLVLFVNNDLNHGSSLTWMTYQIFFWPSGIVTYTTPVLILATTVYALFIHKNRLSMSKKIISLSLITFLAGLFNETFPATLIAISLGLLILSFMKPFKKALGCRKLFVATILSSTLSLIVLLMSTGSQQRQLATGAHSRNIVTIIMATLDNLRFSIGRLMFRPKELFLIFVIGLLIAMIINYHTKHQKSDIPNIAVKGLVASSITIIAAIGSMTCSFLLVAIGYGESSGVLPRTLSIPQILYVSGLTIFATSLSLLIINKTKPCATKLILISVILVYCLFIPNYMGKIINQLNSSISYSNAWSEQEALITAQLAKDKNQTIYLPQSVSGIGGGGNVSCVGSTWLNYQIAEYYHVKRVCSVLDPH
jgi:hypothetical protein